MGGPVASRQVGQNITDLNQWPRIDSAMSLDRWQRANHTCDMQDLHDDPVHLIHVDPALNMARFYPISIQPTLFGEASVMRYWGRIGTRGQAMILTYPGENEATAAASKLERQKQRRGYR